MSPEMFERVGIGAIAAALIVLIPEIVGSERMRALEARMRTWRDRPSGIRTALFILQTLAAITLVWFAALISDGSLAEPPSDLWMRLLFCLPLALVPFAIDVVPSRVVAGYNELLRQRDLGRALTFGAGVVLLFGGMGLQFWSTF